MWQPTEMSYKLDLPPTQQQSPLGSGGRSEIHPFSISIYCILRCETPPRIPVVNESVGRLGLPKPEHVNIFGGDDFSQHPGVGGVDPSNLVTRLSLVLKRRLNSRFWWMADVMNWPSSWFPTWPFSADVVDCIVWTKKLLSYCCNLVGKMVVTIKFWVIEAELEN